MTQKLFSEPAESKAGLGWQVSIDVQYKPWLAAADDASRPAMTGVWIDPAGYAVGTDGFMAAIVPAAIQPELLEDGEFEGCLIPAELVKQAHKMSKRAKAPAVNLHIAGPRISYLWPGGGVWAEAIEAVFPNWRSLLPDRVSRSPNVGVDVWRAGEICEAVGAASFDWYGGANASSPFIIAGFGSALGLLMPLVHDEPIAAINLGLLSIHRGGPR